MSEEARNLKSTLGLLLCRVIVPVWVLTGATLKFIKASPSTLPQNFLKVADTWGINLNVLLATLISLEFLAVVVMVLLARFARAMAIFMLACFCLILIGEIIAGHGSCGCFGGAFTWSPLTMLIVDGALLIGVILFRPAPSVGREFAKWPVAAAAVLVVAGGATSYGTIMSGAGPVALNEPGDDGPAPVDPGESSSGGETPSNGDDAGPTPVAPTLPGYPESRTNPNPKPFPSVGYWYTQNLDEWTGRKWQQIELLQFMHTWPKGLDQGTRYVVFFKTDCDHCQDMFYNDLAPNPELASKVTAVQVPVSKMLMNKPDNAWEIPRTRCEMLALPKGIDWIFTTPLSLRIEDGIVTCAEEGDHTKCLDL